MDYSIIPTTPDSDSSECSAYSLCFGVDMADQNKDRNVHVYDSKDPTTVLGGLHVTNGITNGNFLSMLDIIFIFETPYTVEHESGIRVVPNDQQLQPGKYYVKGEFSLTDERPLLRASSITSGRRHATFAARIRERDDRCWISGDLVPTVEQAGHNRWIDFEAAHVFPLAFEAQWRDQNMQRWIRPYEADAMNSTKNGLLLESGLHKHFDRYTISINPDDDYKIVFFTFDRKGYAGKYVDPELLNHPERPVDQLLRWHFRQAVLANMKGAGQSYIELDFPPGSDMIGQILRGPRAAERMEFELFNRCAAKGLLDETFHFEGEESWYD